MKLHPIVATALIGSVIALEAWALKEITTLKENVAGLSARVELLAVRSYATKNERHHSNSFPLPD
jgi:hypothetical protein